MAPRIILNRSNKCLTFNEDDLRGDRDYLSSIESTHYSKIEMLIFFQCHITPKAVGTILKKLEKVVDLELSACTAYDSIYREVPVVERRLKRISIQLDLAGDGHDRGDFFDCHEILLHPKLRLPTYVLEVDRMEDIGCRLGDDIGEKYYEWFDYEEQRHTYMVSYLERYKEKIELVMYDNGRPKIWRRLMKSEKLPLIEVAFLDDLEEREEREMEEDDPEMYAERKKIMAERASATNSTTRDI